MRYQLHISDALAHAYVIAVINSLSSCTRQREFILRPLYVIQSQREFYAQNYIARKLCGLCWDPFGRFIILLFFSLFIFIQCGQILKATAVASGRSYRQWNIEINNIQRVISIYQSHCTDQQWLGDHRWYDSDSICGANKSNERCSNRQRKVHKTYTRRT